MNSFPLFNVIYSETETMATVSSVDKDRLCETMKKLDAEGFELCYGLMKCFAHSYNNDNASPPYNPKKNKTGYKFDVDEIPDRLVSILLHFSLKHVDKLKEESARFVVA